MGSCTQVTIDVLQRYLELQGKFGISFLMQFQGEYSSAARCPSPPQLASWPHEHRTRPPPSLA